MSDLTLYQFNGACSLIPHAVLLHYNIPVRIVPMRKGPDGLEAVDKSISATQYLSIHHMGYVPALAVDGEIITEVPAVLAYISSLFPGENLLGSPGLEHTRVVEWLAWLSGTLHGLGFAMFWAPHRFSDDQGGFDAIKANGEKLIGKCLGRIESKLQGREFAVGNALTVVDFHLYIFSRWAKQIGVDMETRYPAYSKFAGKLETLQGIREAVQKEELEFFYS